MDESNLARTVRGNLNWRAVEVVGQEYIVLVASRRSWPWNLLVEVLPFSLQLAERVACSPLLAYACS